MEMKAIAKGKTSAVLMAALFLMSTTTAFVSFTLPVSAEETLYIGEDYTFTTDIYVPIVVVADNIVIDGNSHTLQGPGSFGFYLSGRSGVTIRNVIIKGWSVGIYLGSPSFGNMIGGNTFSDNSYGVELFQANDNTIDGNVFENSWYHAIEVLYSDGNRITRNTVTNCGMTGISLQSSSGGTICGNTIANNNEGIVLLGCTGTMICHNNFVSNLLQAQDAPGAGNCWYDPSLLEGNYWSDYTGVDDGSGTGKHAIAGDGIGDTMIPWGSWGMADYYPFTHKSGWEHPGEINPDENTILLDHLNGFTSGTAYGPLTYVTSLTGLCVAANFQTGTYIRYDLPCWYYSSQPWDPTGKEGTIELWINPKEYGNILTFQWFKDENPPTTGYIGGVGICREGDPRGPAGILCYGVWCYEGGPDPGLQPVGATIIPLNEWTHVAVSWGPDGTKLYVNGELDGSSTLTFYPAMGWCGDQYVYVYLNDWGQPDRGCKCIDELHVSKVQRTDEEIHAHYLQGVRVLPPTTTSSLSGTLGQNGWYLSNVEVKLTATDTGGSGVKEIHYILNGEGAVVSGSTVTFTISKEGTNTLEYWAVDNIGNVESPHAEEIKIDKEPPVSTLTIGSPNWVSTDGTFTYVTSDTPFTLTASDDISSVDTTYYRIDTGSWIIYAGPFTLTSCSPGLHVLEFHSVDKAGNTETVGCLSANLIQPISADGRTYDKAVYDKAGNLLTVLDFTSSFKVTGSLRGIVSLQFHNDGPKTITVTKAEVHAVTPPRAGSGTAKTLSVLPSIAAGEDGSFLVDVSLTGLWKGKATLQLWVYFTVDGVQGYYHVGVSVNYRT